MTKRGLWVVVAVFVSGCATDVWDRYYAGLTSYEPETKAYRLRYPSPPWRVASQTGERISLRIDRDVATDSTTEVPAKYELEVDVLPRTVAATELARLLAAEAAAGNDLVVPTRAVTTETGDEGLEAISLEVMTERQQNRRFVVFDGPRGCVRMTWVADPSLASAEVDALIRVFDVREDASPDAGVDAGQDAGRDASPEAAAASGGGVGDGGAS